MFFPGPGVLPIRFRFRVSMESAPTTADELDAKITIKGSQRERDTHLKPHREHKRESERQTDTQTDRQEWRERGRQREKGAEGETENDTMPPLSHAAFNIV